MLHRCHCIQKLSLSQCIPSLLWFLLNIAVVSADLQLSPHFTRIPPLVIPFVAENASTGQRYPAVDLLCCAWPPNARVSLVSSSVTASKPFTFTPLAESDILSGLVLRYGLVTHPMDTSSYSLDQTVRYASLKEAVYHHPAALPTDEVAVRLTISSADGVSTAVGPPGLKQLESMRLHCLAETPFGLLVSRPFQIRSTTLGDFRSDPGITLGSDNSGVALPSSTSPSSSSSVQSNTLKILRNNVGVVDCYLPVDAYPTPVVQIELNGSLIDVNNVRHSQKYRLVHRPDNRRVSLLIRQFQAQDVGLYRCFFVNPLTGQRKPSPDPLINLQLIRPQSPFPPTVFTPLASDGVSSDNGVEQAKAQVIVANEGDNITLFCVIHAAPPPTVATYPFHLNNTGHTRFQRDDMFGLLHITNVRPSDSGFYICSGRPISSTANLHVRSLLRLVTRPRDVSIPRLGGSVQFNCTTSDPQVSAQWLVNGRSADTKLVRRSDDGASSLTVSDVSRQDLGFYQCVAWRPPVTSVASSTEGEWVNATAMLSLETDRVLHTPDDVSQFLPKARRPINRPSDPEPIANTQPPVAEVVFDNLAVLLSWLPVTPNTLPDHIGLLEEGKNRLVNSRDNQNVEAESKEQQSVGYRLEYSVQQTAIEVAAGVGESSALSDTDGEPSSGVPTGDTITKGTITTLTSTADNPPTKPIHGYTAIDLAKVFIGFVGFEAIQWSEPRLLEQQVSTPYLFIAGPPLEPEKVYRFRVLTVNPISGTPIQSPSGWSKVISMEHISSVGPPEVQLARPLSDGQIHVIWKFDGQTQNSILPVSGSPPIASDPQLTAEHITLTPSSTTSNSSSGSHTSGSLFHADSFLILTRPVVKPKRGAHNTVEYGTYLTTIVNGSDAREGLLKGLNRSMDYQIIVYAVRGTGNSRQITRFSKPVFVNFVPPAFSGRYSILTSLANNKVLYLVLGGIAALMIFVVFILILMCMCRQLRDGPRRITSAMVAAERKKQNGYMRGNSDTGGVYKDPSVVAAVHHSTPDGTSGAGPGAVSVVGQVSLPEYYSQHHRQSQVDPYNSQKDPLLCNTAVPSHQMMMGSQLQLSNYQQNSCGQQAGPPHHQSHQSLLLPPNNSVICSNRVFQTGTLPAPGNSSANQRYYRWQQQPGMLMYNNGTSNRATTPGPMLEMTDYGCHQQQQQQTYAPHQQLPPVPHLHSPDLPMPGQAQHQLMNTGGVAVSPQQQMGVYYPAGHQVAGLMTPGGMSLKREQLPSSGLSASGSVREHGSAYGTMLQRGGHLTGSFISDQHAMSGTLQPGCSLTAHPSTPAYYQQRHQPVMQPAQAGGLLGSVGSQQALHMSSPTSAMQAYHQHQVPVPGAGVYYGQQAPSEVMFVAGGVASQQLQQQGFRPTDGESVYSYFSQQDATGTPGGHPHLNALPEENNMMLNTSIPSGYVDSGMQTGELNTGPVTPIDNEGSSTGGGGPAGSGTAAGGHRHHRRRRRKQPQQGQQQQTSESTGGDLDSQQPHLSDGQLSQPPPALASDTQAGETQITPLELSEEVKRQLSLSAGGTYSDADPLSGQPSFACPPPPPGYHLQQQSLSYNSAGAGIETNGHIRNFRYDSPQHSSLFSGSGCPLPPPNQPPPPPPPNAVMTYNKGYDGLPVGSLDFTTGGYYPNNQQHQRVGQFYSPPTAVAMDYRRDYPTPHQHHVSGGGSSSGGLLVGPPPRVRDYSEYGIPRGIGLPPTPDAAVAATHNGNRNSPLQQQQFIKGQINTQFVNNGMVSPAANGMYPDNTGTGHYREGQA